MSAAVLELRGVSASYGQTAALWDVCLAVERGGIAAVLGPNGAGKTTLLKVVSGLLQPSAGSVLVDGQDVTRMSASRRARLGLCLIPEGRGVFPRLTVRENLLLQTPPWDRDAAVDAALDAFPVLRDRLRQRAGSMSARPAANACPRPVLPREAQRRPAR